MNPIDAGAGLGTCQKFVMWYNNRINPVIIQIYMPARFVASRQRAMADYTISPSELWYNNRINKE